MEPRKIMILFGLGAAGLLWAAWQGEGSREAAPSLTRVDVEMPVARMAPVDELLSPSVPSDGGSRPVAHVPVELQGQPAPDPVAAEEAPPVESLPPRATLYQHATHDAGFPGLRWIVNLGATDAGRSFGDNEASAVEVPAGYVLRLYRDPGQGGESTIIGQGLHNLAPYGWNDCVSSVSLVALDRPLITGFPGAYEHVWLHGDGLGPDLDPGWAWTMELDRGRASQLFTAVQGDFEDNRASALFVPPRFEVSLFDEPDGRGAALVLGPGMYDLGRLRFNDRVSSVRVRRMEDDE